MLKLFITIVLFLCVIAYADAARPRRKESPCDKYEKEIKNSKGVTKCIPKEGSCNGSTDFVNINCFQSPCAAFKNSCPEATKCYTTACNSCKAFVYDDEYNKLNCKPAASL